MLNIKTEEQVIKKTVHKIGIWLTLLDLKRILNALTELESPDKESSDLWLEIEKLHADAEHQINEISLDAEADDIMLAEEEEDARNGDTCDVKGCE